MIGGFFCLEIAAGDLPVERVVTRRVDLDGGPDAFALLASGTADEIKVLVSQQEDSR